MCTVDESFEWCSRCPWPAFCRGCVISRGQEVITEDIGRIAVDWKPTALYLRYQHSVELASVWLFDEVTFETYYLLLCNPHSFSMEGIDRFF